MEKLPNFPKHLSKEVARIAAIDDLKELEALLKRALEVSLEQVIVMAAVLARMAQLGADLSEHGSDTVGLYLKVAYGQVLPELLVALQRSVRGLLDKASKLPLPDQRRIAAGEPLKVYRIGGDHNLVPPKNLTGREIAQIFSSEGIRGEAEQAAYLRDKAALQAKPSGEAASEIRLDRKRRCYWFGNRAITAVELTRMLEELLPIGRK